MIYIVGLGNPGGKYEGTRHNAGRDIVEVFQKKHNFEPFEFDKKANALISSGKVGKEKVMLILPETFMNESGKSVRKFVKNKKDALNTIVVYDELDVAIGGLKISFNKGSGGHKGVESTINHIKTKEFPRLRVGISGVTPSGKIKKPLGEEKVVKHVLSAFNPKEKLIFAKVKKKGVEALEMMIQDGYLNASNKVNGWK